MINLKKLYSMAVCFVSAMVVLCCTICLILNMADLIFPRYSYQSQKPYLEKFSSIENFISSQCSKQEKEKLQSLSQAEIVEKMQLEQKSYIQEQQNCTIRDIIRNVIMIFVGMVFWMVHWKIYKRNALDG